VILNVKFRKALFLVLTTLSAMPFVTTPISLTAGIIFGIFLGNPWPDKSSVGVKNFYRFRLSDWVLALVSDKFGAQGKMQLFILL